MEENKKKCIKRKIFLSLKLLVLLIFLLLFPDLLFALRGLIKSFNFFSDIFCKDIDDLKYIELMLMPLLNCITITISVMALITAKSSAKTQEISQNSKILYASINVIDTIHTNMRVAK